MADLIAAVMGIGGKLQYVYTIANKFALVSSTGGTSTSNGSVAANVLTLNNNEGITLVPGTPVYINTGTSIKRAIGNSKLTASVIGLVSASIPYADSGIIKTGDELTLTTLQWDVITGQTGGLTVDATYFLSTTAIGKLTKIAPSSGFMVSIGRALSSTRMQIVISKKVQL
ncbi:MAG: hypothetical protein ACD_84C00006G0002 [uncultured bacterium]|nr:MAG: hypothetical protein ACD_84C00006G0002 [uncultured bacterium]